VWVIHACVRIAAVAQLDSSTVTIDLGAHIALSSYVCVSSKLGMVRINGNGYSLNGQGSVRCLRIVNATVELNDMNITNGYGKKISLLLVPGWLLMLI
jgi:hypothetical protein